MATIEAQALGKRYGPKQAVDDLSFRVDPGSVTGFLGPNGSGKSTTMRLMLGLDNGVGSTTFDGMAFRSLGEPMRHVGALLEAKPFHPTRTARNHLRLLAAANGITDARVDQVLELVGLTAVARGKPKKFSLGMGQRLGIAAALLGDPHTLILDEPANGLDPQGIQWLRGFLKDFAAHGHSVFVSSHLLAEMALMADRLVVIGRGRLIASGPVDDFVKTSRRRAVVLRSPDLTRLGPVLAERGGYVEGQPDGSFVVTGLDRDQVGDVAYEIGARVHELTSREATLEQAFLEATGVSEEFVGGSIGGEPGSPPAPPGRTPDPGDPNVASAR
ncbi:MAG: ATP-binding cassette domain-containing protein [Nocardioidaceae bacterium]|nr:ATP-binding cassette domain-containing protein [Nocardioidaceae bacterium]